MGVKRHGGFIPHDDDIDLECLESDFEQVKLLFKAQPSMTFERVGLYSDGTQVCRIFPVPYPDLPGRISAGVDVFLRQTELIEDREWPSSVEILPLQRFNFHGIEVFGPAEPDTYLSRCYGPDWAHTVHVWNHMLNDLSMGSNWRATI